jgi:hypothetical protein
LELSENNKEVVTGKWLLMKHGLYWRPNSQGYTGLKSEAGRYTDEQVAIYRRNDEYTVSIIEAETADEISPSCYPDIAQKHLQGLLSFAQVEIERLKEECHLSMRTIAEERYRAEAAEKERDALREALTPFANIGISSDPMSRITVTIDREFILAARSALKPLESKND